MIRISQVHVIFVSVLIIAVIIFLGVASNNDVTLIQDGGATTTTTAAGSITNPNSDASNAIDTNNGDFSKGITISNGETKFENAASKISLPYLHCGPVFNGDTSFDPTSDVEVILLHGAAFTKKNWEESGILKSLCTLGNRLGDGDIRRRRTSVIALDLSVKSTGEELSAAKHALYERAKILSGKPSLVVTPSASGKAMVELAQYYHHDTKLMTNGPLLKETVQAWISVASPAVISPKLQDSELRSFVDAEIPVLAIHGDKDMMGKKVTKRLVGVADAEGVELKGSHPCYLDSPDEFVNTVLDFVDRKLLGNGNEGK